MVCRRPGTLWEVAWIDKRGADSLEITSVFFGVISGLIGVALLGTTRMIREFDDWVTMAGVVIEFLIVSPVLVLLLFVLNGCARAALMLFVRARSGWISAAAAQTVVAHVSTVWVLIVPSVALLTIHRMVARSHGGEVSDVAVLSGIQFLVMDSVRVAGAIVLAAGVGVFVIGLWTGAQPLSESDG